MKRTFIILALFASAVITGCNFNKGGNNIALSTKDSTNDFDFSASYPERKTAAVQLYLENSLHETRIFNAISDKKKTEITLADGARFYLNYEPGFLEIHFEKDKNSYTAYAKLKKVCAGFGKALKD
ncbi:MAG: hypothetical protein V4541_03010 [Bacteroidota bacterium]